MLWKVAEFKINFDISDILYLEILDAFTVFKNAYHCEIDNQ